MPDVTDLRNRDAGPCVICRRHVARNAGWRVRGAGRWLGVACDEHGNTQAQDQPPAGRPSVVERARDLEARVRADAAAGRLPFKD